MTAPENHLGAAAALRLSDGRRRCPEDRTVAGNGEVVQKSGESRLRRRNDACEEKDVFEYPAEVVGPGLPRLWEKLVSELLRLAPMRIGIILPGLLFRLLLSREIPDMTASE